MNSKMIWNLLMAGTIGLWVVSILMGFLLFPDHQLLAWALFIALVLIHTAELPVSLNIGRNKGISLKVVVVKTILFGFTWWLPVKRGILPS